jgi:predicted DNA-binding helix-hairpin-helix protein
MFVCQLLAQVQAIREKRLYQADWFMRFTALKPMKFSKNNPFLDLEVDPKMAGLRNITQFPVIIQHAPLEMICAFQELVSNQHKIVYARRFQNLSMEHLKKI